MKLDARGQAAIVTGGASGLGAATAKRLATLGAKVTIFDFNGDLGRDQARSLGASFAQVDVSDSGSVTAAIAGAEEANGVARILVNCAGAIRAANTMDVATPGAAVETFRRLVEVNLIGTYNVCAAFCSRLSSVEAIGEDRAVIINTASAAAYDGQAGMTAYAASKAGVAGLTLPLARELAEHGIRVAAIAPGYFRTGMSEGATEAARQRILQHVPHPRRFGEPSEFADLVVSIINNAMLNGTVIRTDGALRLPFP